MKQIPYRRLREGKTDQIQEHQERGQEDRWTRTPNLRRVPVSLVVAMTFQFYNDIMRGPFSSFALGPTTALDGPS